MTEVEQPPQNGIDLSANEDDDNSKSRPADIEQVNGYNAPLKKKYRLVTIFHDSYSFKP